MVTVDDNQETQVLDIDSPPLGDRFDDAIGEGHDDGADLGQNTVPLGETLPLDDFFETERMKESPVLYDETEVLGDAEGDGDGGIDNRADTQLVDEYEETAAVDNSDKGTETTELLSSDEGLSDDGASPMGDERKSRDVELELERNEHKDEACVDEQGKEDDLVDSDASTDDEVDAGGSFSAIRAASLRHSGLSAERKLAYRRISSQSRSCNHSEYFEKQDNVAGNQTGAIARGVNSWLDGDKDLISLNAEAGEGGTEQEAGNFRKDGSKCVKNTRVRKLIFEVSPHKKDETTSEADDVIEEVDRPHSPATDYVVAGLSYVGSQEPGDLSQANALEVVDNFLSVNDVGSSQEVKPGKIDAVKSPPISSRKGAQLLAEKVDHRSVVGKAGIFDWNDSLEDEGGGEFFSKKKDSFFENRGTRKTQTLPRKARDLISRITRDTLDMNGGEEGANPEDCGKITTLSHSDSRLLIPSFIRSETVHISETKTKKNLIKCLAEKSSSEFLEQPLDATDRREGLDGTCDVGPDTQMAAEAMEALVHGSLVNFGMEKDRLPEDPNKNSITAPTKKKASSKNASLRNITLATESGGTATRSKLRRTILSNSNKESPTIARKYRSEPRKKKSLKDTTTKTEGKKKELNQMGHTNAKGLVNGTASSKYPIREKAQGMLDKAVCEGVEKRLHTPMSNGHFSASKEFIPGVHHFNSTPVAHRTRHSKRVNFFEQSGSSLHEYGKDVNKLIDASIPGSMVITDKLVSDESKLLKGRKKHADAISDKSTTDGRTSDSHTNVPNLEVLHDDECRNSSVTDNVFRHPKRRRTLHITSSKPDINSKLDVPSLSVDGLPAKPEHPFKQQGRQRVFIRSACDLLLAAKQKKRSVFSHMASQTDGLAFNITNMPIASGVQTRSSVNSLLSNPYPEKGSKELLAPAVLYETGLSNAAKKNITDSSNPHVHQIEVELSKQGVDYTPCTEIVEENAKFEGSPKENIQLSGVACTTPTPSKKIAAVSPVCMGQDPSGKCNKASSRSSIARELLRLEDTKAFSTPSLKGLRRRKDITSIRVLFSHHLDEDIIKHQKKILARLGVSIASSMSDATHFVTDMFVRTRNMLEAMALGKPVVSHMWLESCGQASCFIDEKNYILRDAKKEKEIGFSMPVSLARACQCPLLQGKRVFITPNVKPDRELIASLVKAAHGQPLERIGRSAMKEDKIPDDLLVISCEEDYSICMPLLKIGAGVFSSELLLNGIVVQKLEYERHRLFLDHVKRTRSTIWLRHKNGDQFRPVTKCA